MFVSHENANSGKKKFQKPNILRRKSNYNIKATSLKAPNKTETYESCDVKSLVTTSLLLEAKKNDPNIEKKKIHNEVNQDQSSVNMESLLMGEVVRENLPIFDNEFLKDKDLEKTEKQKWCVDFLQEPQKIILSECDGSQIGSFYLEQKSDIVNKMVPLAAVTSNHQDPQITKSKDYIPTAFARNVSTTPSVIDMNKNNICDQLSVATVERTTEIDTRNTVNDRKSSSMTTIHKITIEQLTHAPKRYKCDVPQCKKEFFSEEKLKKHARTHNKDNIPKPPRQTTVECPVKVHSNGLEVPCGRIFLVREELVKHLNEDHTIEQAAYRCTECGRRFFWAGGLRAHGRSHAAGRRAALACPWPGCGRVFRQPCRLREHARAHTGDKPYPCSYPNCGWSFRTASKLVRHARRHTGERRHACAVCGRAFLRREHLRDHVARHHAPREPRHECPRDDCQHSFTNMSSLYLHMKKVHKTVENTSQAVPLTIESQEHDPPKEATENLFMVSLLEPSPQISEVEVDQGNTSSPEDGHSARTHCTWPLSRTEQYEHTDAYILEEDVQIEQSEGSESNIYTVRSDLFLHGNILHNEDSEQMSRCVRASESGAGALPLDAELLLDAPSVHLDQNELYTDAVDESAFRVFLLSGEDLS